jgi:hypothetical protein
VERDGTSIVTANCAWRRTCTSSARQAPPEAIGQPGRGGAEGPQALHEVLMGGDIPLNAGERAQVALRICEIIGGRAATSGGTPNM